MRPPRVAPHLPSSSLHPHLDAHPQVREVQARLAERLGIPEGKSRTAFERMLRAAVDDFGVRYLDEMRLRLERIADLRERSTTFLDGVLGQGPAPADPSPQALQRT